MRMSPGGVANLVAWSVLGGLGAAAVVLVVLLGPFGLLLLGLLTLFVCSQVTMDEHAAGWGSAIFHARMRDAGSPEQRAATAAERRATLLPVRFYGRCGAVLVAAGMAGLAWQYWR